MPFPIVTQLLVGLGFSRSLVGWGKQIVSEWRILLADVIDYLSLRERERVVLLKKQVASDYVWLQRFLRRDR